MRAIAIVPVVLALLASAARADRASDEDFDEDGEFAGFRAWSIGLSYSGHATRLDGTSESGWGPALELAIGRYRWQYLVEGRFAPARIDEASGGMHASRADGSMVHGGVGARWLARQFQTGSNGGVELYLVSVVAAQRYSFDETRVSRAAVALGFGLQARAYKRPRLAFRFEARALNDGFAAGMGVAW